MIVIQYKVEEPSSLDDFDRRIHIERLMDECLKQNGLGYCDGGDMGRGEMNIFCLVTDTGIAKAVIVRRLQEERQLSRVIIAERRQEEYKVLWPENFTGIFSIL